MISIIDRYIAKLFLAFFAGGMLVFITLFVTIDFMSNMLNVNASTATIMNYYLLDIPSVMHLMLPVACLMATMFTLSTLSRNNELVALFSSGMSLARISTPILVAVMLISSLMFFLNDRVFPVVNQKKNYVLYVDILKKPGLYSTVKTDRIWYRSGNSLFNIKTMQPDKGTAQGFTIYYFDSAWKLIQMITAKYVEFKGTTWELHVGAVTLFSKESSAPLTQDFAVKFITVADETADIQRASVTTDSLNLADLKHFINRNKEAGLETLSYEVEYQARFAFAVAAFVMSFLGIPFSASRQRAGGTAFNVGATLLLAFGYWALYSSGITMGKHGALPPMLAVWLPNVGMVALSSVFLFRLRR